MCGIFGIYKHQGSPKFDYIPLVKAFFKNVMTRGRDATGYAYIHNGVLYFNKLGIDAEKFIGEGYVDTLNNDFSSMIGHVRHSTRGSPKDNRNNHPLIADDVLVFALVHNGVISGDYHGKRALNAEVDTAILRAMVSDKLEEGKPIIDAVRESVENLAGSMTVAIIAPTFDGIILTKVRNPLWLAYIPQLKVTVFCSTEEILKETMNTFFPKFNGVFPPYYTYEPPDESLVVVTENHVDVSKLDRRDASWSSAYDWRTFGTATTRPAPVGVSKQKTLTDIGRPEQRYIPGEAGSSSVWGSADLEREKQLFPKEFSEKESKKKPSKGANRFHVNDAVTLTAKGKKKAWKSYYFQSMLSKIRWSEAGRVANVKRHKGKYVYDVLYSDGTHDVLIVNMPEEWLKIGGTPYTPDVDEMEEEEEEEWDEEPDEFGDYP